VNKKISIAPITPATAKLDFIHDSRAAAVLPEGVTISETIYQVEPADLRPNPLNGFFKEESTEYFERLTQDIRERGIIVSLIAKRDGMLLAGHNRLKIAVALGLPRVPVQYVENELTGEQEKAFVIKDNLYRRQLTQEDRLNLYKILVVDFEEKITVETRGGDRKSQGSKGNVSPLIQARTAGITAEDLVKEAHAAGVTISHATAKKDMAKARALAKGSAKARPTSPTRKSVPAIKKYCEHIMKELDGADQVTRDSAIAELVELIDLISGYNRRLANPLNEIRKKLKL
jgi:ParB-like chromosome segregation protein Spo0J